MALIKCRECGKDISETAEKCPHCGATVLNGLQATGELLEGCSGCLMAIVGLIVVFFLIYNMWQ